MTQEEPFHSFVSLGLTYLQAKVYFALLKIGPVEADVRKISQISNVARQDIYRILPTLEKQGLVVKVIANPVRYRSILLKHALSKLMEKKTEEYQQAQYKAKLMEESFEFDSEKIWHEDRSQFIITSERKLFLKKLNNEIALAQTSIDIIYSKEKLSLITFHAIEAFKKSVDRGARIRAITDEWKSNLPNQNTQTIINIPGFKLKLLSKSVPVGLTIIDGKEVNLRTSERLVPNMWTNNSNVVTLAQLYFDGLWKQAKVSKK